MTFSVAAVSGGDDSELARHRRQGHIPFNPNCLECAKGRSVFQHRRDKGDRKEVCNRDVLRLCIRT